MSATDRINALGAWIDRGLEWDDAEGIAPGWGGVWACDDCRSQ